MPRKLLNITGIIFILYLELAGFSGCMKEYSFEGRNSTVLTNDTSVKSRITFPFCLGCRSMNDFISPGWNFKYDTSLLCGAVTGAVITPERNGFTFFGPSACSKDTGLVMTVFLNSDALDRDRSNITTNQVIFQYYDNSTFSDIFNSNRLSVSFTIDTYQHSTRVAKGRFSGIVKTKDSTMAKIMDGKFSIKFKG